MWAEKGQYHLIGHLRFIDVLKEQELMKKSFSGGVQKLGAAAHLFIKQKDPKHLSSNVTIGCQYEALNFAKVMKRQIH